ncbi:class I SAM-dependent methyltransferase [Streptomyces albiaxialis]|uniref:S-adenosyl-L-methionine-dependent methyltransferase n=1 Tax=Streptomyces albiaxialis TaxID=329523 RepID=A0ABN2WQG4_9ACTN
MDGTAVRVALWRALHTLVDPPPHVFTDETGLRLAGPEDGWRERDDMDPDGTRTFRAGVVARARFVEDLLAERAAAGVGQYVLLGAGLDTFVQRRPALAARLRVFEADRPGAVEWKRRRLTELGYGVPEGLRLVPVDFEAGASWPKRLVEAGFAADGPAVVASLGVSMYLSEEANAATLRDMAALAPGSTAVMTFQLPLPLVDEADRAPRAYAERGARANGTPFISFFAPDEMLAMAREAGFADVRHVSATQLNGRYFAGRTDGLRMSTGEDLLVATV